MVSWLQEKRAQGEGEEKLTEQAIRDYLESLRRRDHAENKRDHGEMMNALKEQQGALHSIAKALAGTNLTIKALASHPLLVHRTMAVAINAESDSWFDSTEEATFVRTVFGPKAVEPGATYEWPDTAPVATISYAACRSAAPAVGPPSLTPTFCIAGEHIALGRNQLGHVRVNGKDYIARCFGIKRDVSQRHFRSAMVQIDEVKLHG